MRIYNRSDFLKLPKGTFFCKGVQFAFFDLEILVESYPNDFLSISLNCFESFNSEELADRQYDSFENGVSYPVNKNCSRDGCYNNEDIFLVYEKDDLIFIREKIDEFLKNS